MRPTRDKTMMEIAIAMSKRSTCCRRQVGCVLTNSLGHIIGTGYNGVARGQDHCIDKPCIGATLPPGTGLDSCEAIHAEMNAVLQCKSPDEIDTAYVTASPCRHCIKVLMNTSCKRIVFFEEYSHRDSYDLWKSARPSTVSWGKLNMETGLVTNINMV